MKKARKAILEDKKLSKLFLSSCKENEHLEKEDDRKKMYYYRLEDKVANARWQDEIRALNRIPAIRVFAVRVTPIFTNKKHGINS
jgi:hypothetical protein